MHDLIIKNATLIDGYRMAIKAGEPTFENGEATGAMPGRLIRGAQPRVA